MGKGGSTYPRPKNVNAVIEVRDPATGKALEGANRQTNRLYVHHSKISFSTPG